MMLASLYMHLGATYKGKEKLAKLIKTQVDRTQKTKGTLVACPLKAFITSLGL